eukprot:scaffold13772_cov154-Skeletonema_dohrnii-CCMP3373.AAC.7
MAALSMVAEIVLFPLCVTWTMCISSLHYGYPHKIAEVSSSKDAGTRVCPNKFIAALRLSSQNGSDNTSTFVKLLSWNNAEVSVNAVNEQVCPNTLHIRNFSNAVALLFSSNAKVLYQATVSSYSSKLHPKQFTMLYTRTRNAVIELIVSSRHHHCHEHDDI